MELSCFPDDNGRKYYDIMTTTIEILSNPIYLPSFS